jgi:hypothetical protein
MEEIIKAEMNLPNKNNNIDKMLFSDSLSSFNKEG